MVSATMKVEEVGLRYMRTVMENKESILPVLNPVLNLFGPSHFSPCKTIPYF